MDDYALVLRLDITDQAPEGPGWYLYATGTGEDNKGQLIRKPQRISGKHAVTLALQMQQGLSLTQNEMSPSQIVQAGSQRVVQRINDQIAYAETQAKRIGQLRRILQTETEQQGE